MTNANTNAPALIAYQVDRKENGKAYWHRIGAAWQNKKGGYQIKLSTLPVDGELVLMPPRKRESKSEEAA